MKKKWVAMVCVWAMLLTALLPSAWAAEPAGAVSSNIHKNNYTTWSAPVTSYLYENEAGGLTRAAEALYISQPALSKYLSRLERNLGVALFDHSSSPLKLSYAGRRYYEYVKRIQAMDRQLHHELTSIRSDESGEIRVGIAQWRGSMLLPVLIPAFQKKYPHISIEVEEGRAMQIETALLQGRVDLCLRP